MFFFRVRRLLRAARSRQRDARKGALLGLLAITFVVLGTLVADRTASTLAVLLVGGVTAGALVVVSELLPWRRMPRLTLLLLPTTWLLGLAVLGQVGGPFMGNFSGMVVLAFLYAGLTQAPWRSAFLLPVGLVVWTSLLLGADTSLVALAVRLPIALIIWLAVAEAVAARTSVMRTEMYRLNREIDRDPLTGLANRRALTEVLDAVVPGSAVCLVDIDHFKAINDELGHATGDQVLAQFGRVLRRTLGLLDAGLRYGGEEFLVVLQDGSTAAVEEFLERLRLAGREVRPRITHSVGVAIAQPGESATTTLDRADAALYEAKHAGRDRYVVHRSPAGALLPPAS